MTLSDNFKNMVFEMRKTHKKLKTLKHKLVFYIIYHIEEMYSLISLFPRSKHVFPSLFFASLSAPIEIRN